MLINRDHDTGSLFDPWRYLGDKRRLLLEKSWAAVFREYLLSELPLTEIGAHFSDDLGRPTKDLSMVLGALILQQLHDYTDKETVEAVALNIQWQYALDIQREQDAYLCERTLRNYRRLVIERELDQVMFRTLTDKLITSIGVDTSHQRLDSTAIRSAMRHLTRLGTFVETVSKFLRELRRKHPDLVRLLDPDDWRRYVDRTGEGCFAPATPSQSKRRLPAAARDLYRLVEQFRSTPAAGLESYQLLARVLEEQCEIVENDPDDDPLSRSAPTVIVKAPQDMACDNVVNPADPDTSYNAHRGLGYLVQIMESFSGDDTLEPKPDLITHVAVGKMNTHDRKALVPALSDTQERNVGPLLLLADSHYGSNECVKEAAARGVELLAPIMTTTRTKQGKLTLEDFELNASGRVLRCPQGHEPVATRATSAYLHVRFDESICTACTMGERCLASGNARFRYRRARVRNRTKRLAQQEPHFRDRYRMRSGIEATMSRFKHQMNMARLRVRGMEAVRYRAVLRALGLNIFRVTAYRQATC